VGCGAGEADVGVGGGLRGAAAVENAVVTASFSSGAFEPRGLGSAAPAAVSPHFPMNCGGRQVLSPATAQHARCSPEFSPDAPMPQAAL